MIINRTVLQARLSDAEAQYHALMTGKQVKVFVDQNGERIEYGAASSLKLAAYIEDLKRQLGLCRISGPLQVLM
jgi:gpW